VHRAAPQRVVGRSGRRILLVVVHALTSLACSTESDPDEVEARAALVDVSRGALSTLAFTSASGTYGPRCAGRSGTWSLPFSNTSTGTDELRVARGNADCVLTVTSLTADVVYLANPPLTISTSSTATASAFVPIGGTKTAFYTSALLGDPTFTAPFTVAFEVSDDPSRISAGRATGSYAGPSSSQSALLVSQSTQLADGVSGITATVIARSLSGKPLGGQITTLSHSGTAVASPSSATTNAAGVATFHVYAGAPTTGDLRARIAGVEVSQSQPITFLDGYATALTHFRLDEAAGSWNGTAGEVIDSGPTAWHGRLLVTASPSTTNATTPSPRITGQTSGIQGDFCGAGVFDGRAVVEVAPDARLNYSTKLSATAWFYATAYPPAGSLASILSNDQNYEFHLTPSGQLFWWWNAAALTSTTTIPLGKWTHVAITFDSSIGRQYIYINGVQDPRVGTWQGTLAHNPCPFYIGGDVGTASSCSILTDRNFRGMIDEVKLFDFELNAAQVLATMKGGRTCATTTP
jgi:hypothetical protein